MEMLTLTLHLGAVSTVCLVFLSCFTSSFGTMFENPSIVYTYNRFAEIEEHCATVLPLASELKPDDDRGSKIKKELSFMNGDWDQEFSGAVPLMQFDDTKERKSFTDSCSVFKLVSFWVADVNPVPQSDKMVSVSGIMRVGITRSNGMFSYKPDEWSPNFHMGYGSTILTMIFEGVYVESKENGGERLMCMLGTAMMPLRYQFVEDIETMNGYSYSNNLQPSHRVQDDQIMLVLRYPKAFSLTNGGISGEMKSLRGKTNATYFDTIRISARPGPSSKFHFGAEEMLVKACKPYPFEDSLVDQEIRLFKEEQFCNNFQSLLSNEVFKFSPKEEVHFQSDVGEKLGPFILSKESNACARDFNDYRLLVQDFRCEEGIDEHNVKVANVSALFRLINFEVDRYVSEERRGLSGMTISAEGIWKSSSGQLCMVGCIGHFGVTSERCKSRLCLYLPVTFTIHQRSIIIGTIWDLNHIEVRPSLYFEMPSHPKLLLDRYQGKRRLPWSDKMPRRMKEWSYRYSKTEKVVAFQNKTKSYLLGIYKNSLLSYPSFNVDHNSSLYRLSDELSFGVNAMPYTSSNALSTKTYVEIDVLSVGPIFGRPLPQSDIKHQEMRTLFYSVSTIGVEVSGHLSTTVSHYSNLSLSVEGIYNPINGGMYLIGCRDIKDFHCSMRNGTKLEEGKDCEIEIKVDYPPINARWLFSSEVKIFIHSRRNMEDSLYFSPISLLTNPMCHKNQLDNIIMRKTVEGFLRIIILTVAILLSWNQLHYASKAIDPTHTSLVMLGIHALGYCIPLLTGNGNDILFKWKVIQTHSHSGRNYDLNRYEHIHLIESAIRILLLVALVLTLRLAQRVHGARNKRRQSKKQGEYPSEKYVFLLTLAFHIGGFLVAHTIQQVLVGVLILLPPNRSYTNNDGGQQFLRWMAEIGDYCGVVQDLFLLPQIVGYTLWQGQGKPLRKMYYIGYTTLRLLVHVYDCISDPIPEPYYDFEEYWNMSLELHSMFRNIMVVSIIVLLAFVVYMQQECQQTKCSKIYTPKWWCSLWFSRKVMN